MKRAAFESAALLHLNPAFAFVCGVSTFEVSSAWSPISREGEKQSGAHAKTIRAHLQASNGQEWRQQSGTDSTTMCANNPDHMRKQSGAYAKTIRKKPWFLFSENMHFRRRLSGRPWPKQSGEKAKTIRLGPDCYAPWGRLGPDCFAPWARLGPDCSAHWVMNAPGLFCPLGPECVLIVLHVAPRPNPQYWSWELACLFYARRLIV